MRAAVLQDARPPRSTPFTAANIAAGVLERSKSATETGHRQRGLPSRVGHWNQSSASRSPIDGYSDVDEPSRGCVQKGGVVERRLRPRTTPRRTARTPRWGLYFILSEHVFVAHGDTSHSLLRLRSTAHVSARSARAASATISAARIRMGSSNRTAMRHDQRATASSRSGSLRTTRPVATRRSACSRIRI
jgi:hypothetical protein